MFFNGVFGKCQLSYFHANGQTLMQRRYQADPNFYDNFFYLHDRLGSTRQVINASASVVNTYTYDPWGNAFASEKSETVSNHYWFANYYWDGTSGMYYLNARWYDPIILRLTGRDPVKGKYQEPLTLHQYLYCLNNPVNRTDPDGQFSLWMQAKEASVKVGAKIWAMNKIQASLTLLNGIYNGYLNTIIGPQNMSDKQLFAIGFSAGVIEMQVGLKFGATAGTTAASIFQNTANQLGAENKSLGWAAFDVALSALIGAASDIVGGDEIEALRMFLIGLDKDLSLYAASGLVDFFNN